MGKQTRRIWRGFLVMTKFPKGYTLPLSPIGAFLPCKKWKAKKNLLCLFSVFQRKWLASVYERHNESSTFDPLKNRFFSIWFHENFNYRVLLLLKTQAASAILPLLFAFWGLGLAPSGLEVGILNGSEKSTLCVSLLNAFKIFGFSPSFAKNCPWRNEVKSKKLSFSENRGQFSWKIGL